jgi:hypothetical protein
MNTLEKYGLQVLAHLTEDAKVAIAEEMLHGTSYVVIEKVEEQIGHVGSSDGQYGSPKPEDFVPNHVPGVPQFTTTLEQNNPEHYAETQKAWAEANPAEALAQFLTDQDADKKWPYKHRFYVSKGGRTYQRIVQQELTPEGSDAALGSSVYCFVDRWGQIFKADGWKGPAKGVRGTVSDVLSGKTQADSGGSWLYASKG